LHRLHLSHVVGHLQVPEERLARQELISVLRRKQAVGCGITAPLEQVIAKLQRRTGRLEQVKELDEMALTLREAVSHRAISPLFVSDVRLEDFGLDIAEPTERLPTFHGDTLQVGRDPPVPCCGGIQGTSATGSERFELPITLAEQVAAWCGG
jgi:hypothetical protein